MVDVYGTHLFLLIIILEELKMALLSIKKWSKNIPPLFLEVPIHESEASALYSLIDKSLIEHDKNNGFPLDNFSYSTKLEHGNVTKNSNTLTLHYFEIDQVIEALNYELKQTGDGNIMGLVNKIEIYKNKYNKFLTDYAKESTNQGREKIIKDSWT